MPLREMQTLVGLRTQLMFSMLLSSSSTVSCSCFLQALGRAPQTSCSVVGNRPLPSPVRRHTWDGLVAQREYASLQNSRLAATGNGIKRCSCMLATSMMPTTVLCRSRSPSVSTFETMGLAVKPHRPQYVATNNLGHQSENWMACKGLFNMVDRWKDSRLGLTRKDRELWAKWSHWNEVTT